MQGEIPYVAGEKAILPNIWTAKWLRPIADGKWLQSGTTFAAKPPHKFRPLNHELAGSVKVGKIVSKLRQDVSIDDVQIGKMGRQSTDSDRVEDKKAVLTRLTGAVVRAILMVLMIVTPSILVLGTNADTRLIVALVAVVAAVFTFIEYNSVYPSLVEFRAAPPFNRIRFIALFLTVFALSLIARGEVAPTTLTRFVSAIGNGLGATFDFPYSPVRLVVLMMPADAPAELINKVRMAAGLSYLVSIMSLSFFVLVLRLRNWPNQTGGFNVWTNLPTFDPTAGGDVVARLRRDSQINLILGFLLPFIIPAFVKLASDMFDPISLADPHTLIWTMTAWAFLPSSLLMRGIAVGRVAQMIENKRKRGASSDNLFQPA
jgi:hypothetical protein